MTDFRRHVPRTDVVLAEPPVSAAIAKLGRPLVKRTLAAAQQKVREGALAPENIVPAVLTSLPKAATSMRPVLNATGVLLHTNLGRAPLSAAAIDALVNVAGTTDVELDVATGERGERGAATMAALREAVPAAESVHVVNNGAASLALAATALGANKEIVIARGEMVEIGDGFRLPELITATGARLHEIGTTNRVMLDDYRQAIGDETAFVLKVHPSNFVITGFTATVSVSELSTLDVPVVVDIGSGLLRPHAALPDEPDATTTIEHGADLVTCSGDKLLGGPQAGLVLGDHNLMQRLRRHPLARALRPDKLTLAALEATLIGPPNPTVTALVADLDGLRQRATTLASALVEHGVNAKPVPSTATVGGGSAPSVTLDSAAISLPERYATALRTGRPPVLGRIENGRCLLDLRSLPPEQDETLFESILTAQPL